MLTQDVRRGWNWTRNRPSRGHYCVRICNVFPPPCRSQSLLTGFWAPCSSVSYLRRAVTRTSRRSSGDVTSRALGLSVRENTSFSVRGDQVLVRITCSALLSSNGNQTRLGSAAMIRRKACMAATVPRPTRYLGTPSRIPPKDSRGPTQWASPASWIGSSTQGRSRVPELGSLGSVRGALRNERPY